MKTWQEAWGSRENESAGGWATKLPCHPLDLAAIVALPGLTSIWSLAEMGTILRQTQDKYMDAVFIRYKGAVVKACGIMRAELFASSNALGKQHFVLI